MKRNTLDCLQCPCLLQGLCSILSIANPMIPLKVSYFSYTNIIVVCFCILCYLLFLFPFYLLNIELEFYLSYTFSLLVAFGVNFHSPEDSTSIPLPFFIWEHSIVICRFYYGSFSCLPVSFLTEQCT